MATKNVMGTFVPRHDIEANWIKAKNFIPKKSEMIVYEKESNDGTTLLSGVTLPSGRTTPYTYDRFKFGDGVKKVSELDFVRTGGTGEGEEVDLSDYYTKGQVDALVADINDDIVISDTEPTVSNQTIWLQPLTTDTGAVDYIVEQGVDKDNKIYYEKWNNGIVKYYATQAENVTMSDGTTKENQLTIPSNIVKTVITHNITVGGLTSVIANVGVVGTEKFEEDAGITIKYTLFFASMNANFTTSHTIIGFWK